MGMLSQAKAAKLAGVSRGTIANRIEDGKLSRTPEGIDVAELVRVFPQITSNRIETFLSGETVNHTDNSGELSGQHSNTLSETNELLEERLKAVDADKLWLRELLDRREQQLLEKDQQLAQQAEKITALLPAPGEATPLEKANQEIGRLKALLEAPAPRKRFLGIF